MFTIYSNIEQFENAIENRYFIAVLKKPVRNIHDFIYEIGIIFHFPEYYGHNIDAFLECINDLAWIDLSNYCFVIQDYNDFLIDEPVNEKYNILRDFDKISLEWANVPNFKGEEQFRHKADFKLVIIDTTGAAKADLLEAGIEFMEASN